MFVTLYTLPPIFTLLGISIAVGFSSFLYPVTLAESSPNGENLRIDVDASTMAASMLELMVSLFF